MTGAQAKICQCEREPAGQPIQACCLPGENCLDLPPKECIALGGTPMGPGTSCKNTDCTSCPCLQCGPPPDNLCDFGKRGCVSSLTFAVGQIVLWANGKPVCTGFGTGIVQLHENCWLGNRCAYIHNMTQHQFIEFTSCGGSMALVAGSTNAAQASCRCVDPDKPFIDEWNFHVVLACLQQDGNLQCSIGWPVLFWTGRRSANGCVPMGDMGMNDSTSMFFEGSTAHLTVS